MIDFEDQVIIVTGAGRGLGRLYALEVARRGGKVLVNDLGTTVQGDGADSKIADAVVKEIEDADGTATASYDSVATPEGGAAIVRAAMERFGRLDAVVSNAGIFSTVPFDELTVEQWRRMLNVHLDGAFHLCQPAFKVMKAQSYGRFVFITSSAGMFGMPQEAHYAAAKGGIFGLKNVIALEGAEHGILANAVLPIGYSRMAVSTDLDLEKPEERTGFLKLIEPELVVPMVAYLASRACEFTHQNYAAVAGRFARVFVGYGEGWLAGAGSVPTLDDIAANISKVSATEPHSIPASIFDEVFDISTRLEARG